MQNSCSSVKSQRSICIQPPGTVPCFYAVNFMQGAFMISLKNIHSLSDFIRNAKSRIAQLKKSGEPAILTINGEAKAVVLSAEAYQKLKNDLEVVTTLNAVHQGTLEMLRTGVVSA